MKTIAQKFVRPAILGLTAVASLALAAAPAGAANTYVWDDVHGHVSIYGVPSANSIPTESVPNGTRFWMQCWIDNQGSRWFGGYDYRYGRWGYVQARYVSNQVSTPHC
jgi:hypothetical protein